jgi:hypothetical protein
VLVSVHYIPPLNSSQHTKLFSFFVRMGSGTLMYLFIPLLCLFDLSMAYLIDGNIYCISSNSLFLGTCAGDCLGCSQAGSTCFSGASCSDSSVKWIANYHGTYSSWSFKNQATNNYLRRDYWCCSQNWIAQANSASANVYAMWKINSTTTTDVYTMSSYLTTTTCVGSDGACGSCQNVPASGLLCSASSTRLTIK